MQSNDQPTSALTRYRGSTTGPAPEAEACAGTDHWLVGAVLDAFQAEFNLSAEQLAEYLDVRPDRLRWLKLRTRPRPDSPAFAGEVRRLALTFDCDAEALAYVLSAE
jgi:hypothetical protein